MGNVRVRELSIPSAVGFRVVVPGVVCYNLPVHFCFSPRLNVDAGGGPRCF